MVELACFPYSVGHVDEGVCLLVQMGPYRILLDCGLSDMTPLKAKSRSPKGEAGRSAKRDAGRSLPADLLLCSHAHPDHAKGLLALNRAFPQLPIYASEVTAQLLPLNWPDETDIPSFCHALPWRTPVEFRDGLSAELYPAGHLPGASSLLLTYTTPQRAYTLFYTGDFLLSNSRLVDGLPLEELRGLKPDVLILEGSYGTARYPHRRQQENQLAERINRAIAEQQSVLLPTPTLGLGQELLMLLRSHHFFTGRDMDIWVDGSVAAGCDAYLNLLPHFPSAVQNFARHQPLFWDERIRPRVRHLSDWHQNGKSALLGEVPAIVITDKDADFSQYCHPESGVWLMLLPHQPGRMGTVESTVEEAINQSELLRSQVQTGQLMVDRYLLSDHCDGPSTTQLIHNLRPQHVVFIHGSPAYLNDLTSLEELQNRYHLHTPAAETLVELPIGETFLQPAAPETHYEGELTERETKVTITLPETMTSDPRWQHFADTGLVEARWQGEELVLRGLPQRELLSQGGDSSTPLEVECCENCLHYRGQRCWNQASPLFGFKVTPEGYCPVFEAGPELKETLADLDDDD